MNEYLFMLNSTNEFVRNSSPAMKGYTQIVYRTRKFAVWNLCCRLSTKPIYFGNLAECDTVC